MIINRLNKILKLFYEINPSDLNQCHFAFHQTIKNLSINHGESESIILDTDGVFKKRYNFHPPTLLFFLNTLQILGTHPLFCNIKVL